SSFEDGTNKWTATNATLASVASPVKHGAKALSLSSSAAGNMSVDNTSFRSSAEAGKVYTGSAWVRTAVSSRSDQVSLSFYDNTGTIIGSATAGTAVADSTSSWTRATVTATAPANTTTVKVTVTVLSTAAAAEV